MFLALRGALVCGVAASAPPNTSAMMGSSPNVIRRMFSLYVIALLLFNLSSCKRISRAPRLLPVWLHDATTHRMRESGIMMQPDFLAIRYLDMRSYATQILQSQPVPGGTLARYHRRMVV